MRDIVQNHMMQLLSMMAMEPPSNLSANAIRDEKVKVVQALRPLDPKTMDEQVVRGQYGPGFVNGEKVIGYREEKNVDPNSVVETFFAAKMYIDNWRWAGVPFYLRAGKRLPKRASEITISFKEVPNILFSGNGKRNEPNLLVLRIQPDEGISLKMNCKVPGPANSIKPVKMAFRYGSYFGLTPPEAYERLICDCILGEGTLFARCDEVIASWRWFTPIIEHWANNQPKDFPNYECGTWGPQAAVDLLARDDRAWRLI